MTLFQIAQKANVKTHAECKILVNKMMKDEDNQFRAAVALSLYKSLRIVANLAA